MTSEFLSTTWLHSSILAMPLTHPVVYTLTYTWTVATLALLLDWALGDPVYSWHPIRLMGRLLATCESILRRLGWNGKGGGILLFLLLAGACLGLYELLRALLSSMPAWPPSFGFDLRLRANETVPVFPSFIPSVIVFIYDVLITYSLLALGDLLRHVNRVENAASAGNLDEARFAASMLVGRDTQNLDFSGCRRAALESLAENLTDGVIAPLFWLGLLGIPGLILFKIASTMDSMVGYKTPAYLHFGWFGARLDDWLCWLPARLTFLALCGMAAFMPGLSACKAWRIGLAQHGLLPGPNPGWSEAAAAGALQIRLIGPIEKNGTLITELWIGDPGDPEGGRPQDIKRMRRLALGATWLTWAGLTLALAGLTAALGVFTTAPRP